MSEHSAEKDAGLVRKVPAPRPVVGMSIVIHRGPIPGTDIGHHWFVARDGKRYGVMGWPHGINKGWSYEVVDEQARCVDDSMFSLAEIRQWASQVGDA